MAIFLEYMGYSVEVPHGETIVGRDVTCALRFNDQGTSRRHLRIVRADPAVEIEDLGSTNGTYLNGQPLTAKTRIAHGDVIEIATHRLRLCVTDESEADVATRKLASLSDMNTIRRPRPFLARRGTVLTIPPKSEPCPRCGAPVGLADRVCASCNQPTGTSRTRSPTLGGSPIDRRREDRHTIELSLIYSSSELEIEATTRDLSTTGVFVCSQVLDPLGTSCELTILVDGGPPLQIRGVVRRVVERADATREPVGLGIEFVDVGAAERRWIELVLAQTSHTEAIQRIDPDSL